MMESDVTIYIVDDDEAVRESLQAWLESEGYRVRALPSGDAYLDSYANDAKGVLLLDLNMPGRDGHEVMGALVARKARIPVIVITAIDDDATRQRALRSGAKAVLTKPIEHDALMAALASCGAAPAA